MDEDKIKELRKKGWIEVWFALEAVGVRKDVVEHSLKEHLAKMEKLPDFHMYEKKIRDAEKVEDLSFLPKDIKEAWSQVIEIRFFVKKFYDLINIIYVYGPSAVEVLGPKNMEMKLEELQDIANTLAGLMHQFAAAGVGGVVIAPGK